MKWCSQAPFYWEATSESSSQCWNGSFCEMRMVFPLAAVLLLSPKWEQFPVYLPGAYHNITVGRHFADIWSVWRSLCGHNHPVMTHSYRNCPLWGRFRERIASGWDSISFCCLQTPPHWKATTLWEWKTAMTSQVWPFLSWFLSWNVWFLKI